MPLGDLVVYRTLGPCAELAGDDKNRKEKHAWDGESLRDIAKSAGSWTSAKPKVP